MVNSELEKIKIDIQTWSSFSWYKALREFPESHVSFAYTADSFVRLVYDSIINEGLNTHRETLQGMINQYHVCFR